MADHTNKRLGGFRILAEIRGASGSQGQVFKAVCEEPPFDGIEPGTVVALKAMAVHDEDGRAWAKLEKRTAELARLSHPNVVKYYGCFSEAGTFNDIHAIVQEFLDGETLKQRLARCPLGLDADEALKVTKSALCGLEYMAANGIVHRDVKPGNIFLCSDGGVKLIDFEIAHQEGGTTTAASNNLVGSFDYMAPDFTDPEFRGDMQSDVFSMGVVMHEVITGRTPYQRIDGGDSQANFAFLQRWARLHVDGTNPIRISSRANRLLAHSEGVLSKALAPSREDRFADFTAFREALRTIRFRDLRNGTNAYRILQRVGKGGFGEVFKARNKNTARLVAIKHLLKAAYAERFYREAKIMAQLRDPCFVSFIDFFVVEHSGNREAFLVMDFLPGMPGSSLRDAIKRGEGKGLGRREVFLAFARYAHGLAEMHRQGIYHRDIKPSNLYYPEGHPERAAIMDLGIARNIHGTATTGQVPGTLDYMPPEVVLSNNRGESGMDIYALGLCLYEALTGKLAFPRLPQGPSAYPAFLARTRIKAMPDISDSAVTENEAIHKLLAQMTDPEVTTRLSDAKEVERRLLKLTELDTVLGPDESIVSDEPGHGASGGMSTEASLDESVPEEAENDETHGTVTIGTRGTAPTGVVGSAQRDALEREREAYSARRRRKWLAVAAVTSLAACGTLWAMRGRLVGWLQARAASAARPAAERVAAAYADRGLEAGRRAEEEWLAHWAPGRRWIDLDTGSYAFCTNRIRAAEMALGDKEAARLAGEVEAAYDNLKVKLDACDRRFTNWREEWAERCASTTFAELEERIKATRKSRVEREQRNTWNQFRQEGRQVAAFYQKEDNSLSAGDVRAAKWRVGRPSGFPEEDFKRFDADIAKARGERVRRENERSAEAELDEVIKAYPGGSDLGDGKAESWRGKWKEKVDGAVLAQMETRIASARARQKEVERQRRVNDKKKVSADACRQILAAYRDDSSDKAKTDAEYGEWVRTWKDDVDLADWFPAKMKEVGEQKRAREERIGEVARKVRDRAEKALQDIVRAYDDGTNKVPDVDGKAEAWRKEWRGQLDAPVFGALEGSLASAREKRVNHDAWEKKHRVLASKTNEVEAVRAALVKDYGNDGVSKAEIDKRYAQWTAKWEADAELDKMLPNWFAERKRTVADAKSLRETLLAKREREQRISAKTNDVMRVRAQLEKGYRSDASDKARLDREFIEWMRNWSADTDLPLGWFASQQLVVEKVKRAREARDATTRLRQEAGKAADEVCGIYRTDGMASGDGSRKMWISTWTNRLDTTAFGEFLRKIEGVREEVKLPKPSVADPLVAKTNQVATLCATLAGNYGDDTIPKDETDKRYAESLMAWESDEGFKKDALRNWFAEQRRKVDEAKRMREQHVADKIKEAVKQLRTIEDAYLSEKYDKPKVDATLRAWKSRWSRDVDLTPGWFAEQSAAGDKAKQEREERDAAARLRQEAVRVAEEVCDIYRKDSVAMGDGSRRMWNRTWTNRLDATTFSELSRKIEEARTQAVEAANIQPEPVQQPPIAPPQVDKEEQARKARVSAKTNAVVSVCRRLVDGYKTDTTDKVKLDKDFTAWIQKWSGDADLPPGFFPEQRFAIEREKAEREIRDKFAQQTERIAREKAEQNRKDASAAANGVCDKYVSGGVDAGNSARQLWDVEWKSVLDEATYKGISAIIDQARAKAEGVQLEKEVRVLLEVDRSRVERWKNQLADAERKITEGKGLLGQAKADTLLNEVRLRKKWVVGVVANLTQHEIEVAGRQIQPGQREFFEFQDAMPQNGLRVSCSGHKPLTVDKNDLDGSVVSIGGGKWKLEPIPKARVQIPQLPDGVICLLGGVKRTGTVEVDGGRRYNYVYRREGHEDQTGQIAVQSGELAHLPPPGEWRADDSLRPLFEEKLADVEICFGTNDGDRTLRLYHEIWLKGYKLTQDDRENVEWAFGICKEDYKKKLDRAKRDSHFKEEDVRKWWDEILEIYKDLVGRGAKK